ncbi:MAG: AAA family ATPase, partial [Candidatus Saccharimonas sp.]|nr:AAA family ATPase [Planctomycetaceae bacterium]
MIKQFRVQNYKALRNVTLNLTPLHVLIGPNDSGKSSMLEAIAAVCRSVDHPLADAFLGYWDGHSLVTRSDAASAVT